MKTLKLTTQFKKDLKKYKHQQSKIDALEEILKKLRNEEPIPVDNNPHRLIGNYKGHMECHVGNEKKYNWLVRKNLLILYWIPSIVIKFIFNLIF